MVARESWGHCLLKSCRGEVFQVWIGMIRPKSWQIVVLLKSNIKGDQQGALIRSFIFEANYEKSFPHEASDLLQIRTSAKPDWSHESPIGRGIDKKGIPASGRDLVFNRPCFLSNKFVPNVATPPFFYRLFSFFQHCFRPLVFLLELVELTQIGYIDRRTDYISWQINMIKWPM